MELWLQFKSTKKKYTSLAMSTRAKYFRNEANKLIQIVLEENII